MTESYEQPITKWLDQLTDGDPEAQRRIWAAYADRIAACGRRAIGQGGRPLEDEDDLTARVMHSLFQRLHDGRIARLSNRHHMWKLLRRMLRNKVAGQLRRQMALKRGGKRPPQNNAVHGQQSDHGVPQRQRERQQAETELQQIEAFADMVTQLPEDDLRQIVMMRIANYSTAEIAQTLNVCERTVERKLVQIRQRLLKEET